MPAVWGREILEKSSRLSLRGMGLFSWDWRDACLTVAGFSVFSLFLDNSIFKG
jgi:hypothetical protein